MKKVCGVLCGLVICCSSVLGNIALNNGNLSEETTSKSIGVEVKEDSVYQKLPLKEQILFYFEDEKQRLLYSSYMPDDVYVTQGDIAKILCHYINCTPIYLPEKELCQSPFIGRLVIECIWSNQSYDEMQPISLNDWDFLFQQAKQFKKDQDYVKKALDTHAFNVKEKVSQYRENSSKQWGYEKVSLGNITKSNMQLRLEDRVYTLYQMADTNYISLKALRNMGFLEEKRSNSIQLIWKDAAFKENELLNIKVQSTFLNNEDIYIGELKTHSLTTEDNTLIPIRALLTYFDLKILEGQISLVPKSQIMSEIIGCDNERIINKTNQPLKIMYTDLYWDGKQIITNQSELQDIPENGELIKNTQLYDLRNAHYLTTIIEYIETGNNILKADHKFGQDVSDLLKIYEQNLNHQKSAVGKETQALFPPSIIIGTMKYAVNGFAKGQKVEIWAAQDGVNYKIKTPQSGTVNIPWNSVTIPKDPPTAKDKPTKEQIETFINSQGMTSSTEYLVWTDLYRQQTYILKGKENEWQLIKTLPCSTGKNKTPTPRGRFELTNRVPYFGVNKGYMCKNAFQIFGDYLYHSIIFDVTGKRLLEGKGVLGNRASQGCIRFSEEDSLWFYTTMKPNTTVWIN